MARGSNATEEQVLSLDDQERAAAKARDLTALERLWSERFFVNAPNSKVVVGREAVLETFVHSGIIDFELFERQVEYVRADGPFVFIMGLETVEPRTDAPSAGLSAGRKVQRRFTNVWREEGGTWRLYARHANVIGAD